MSRAVLGVVVQNVQVDGKLAVVGSGELQQVEVEYLGEVESELEVQEHVHVGGYW